MRLEDISVKFIEGTERPYKEELNLYKIEAENLETMEFCPTCEERLRKKHKSERTIYDYRPSPFTGIEHFYHIKLYSQRYKCTNPKCGCTFTAGELDRSKSSRTLSALMVKMLLDKEILNCSDVGRKFGVSHTFVSDTVMDYIAELNLHYSPSRFCKYLYLHEFIYQKKPRYALISVNNLDEKQLIGFLGYKDSVKEFSQFFQFHLKDKETWFTIATENAEVASQKFEQFPGQLSFVETKAGREKKLRDEYIYNPRRYRDEDKRVYYIELLNEIIKILEGRAPHQELKKWWSQTEKSVRRAKIKPYFKELVSYLLTDGSGYAASYNSYSINFDTYEKHINEYRQRNMPFEKMCLHMMHQEYRKYNKKNQQNRHILTDKHDGTMYYDEQNNIIYRPAPLEDEEQLKEHARKLYEKYSIDGEYYDLFDHWNPEDFICYDPDEELPEALIQQMAEYALDEKIPFSYDDINHSNDDELLLPTNE